MNRRKVFHHLAAAQLGLLGIAGVATTPARAQGYPERPVRILIGVPPGAGPDVEARAFAALLQVELGQTLLVENKPGFTGLLAMDAVAKAAPDGYTLGFGTPNNLTANPRLFDRPLFNVEKDIAPISQFIEHPWLLYINAKLPARTLAEFVALAKASPGRISYASGGVGSYPQLTAEWFQKLAGIRLNHIPYGGATHWQNDLLAVSVPFYTQVLGLREGARLDGPERDIVGGELVFLSFGSNHHDVALFESPEARPADPQCAGLVHLALRIGDSLETLRTFHAHLRGQGVALTQSRDHEVSQSLYLRDPDGLMVEVYVDGDPALWAARPEAVATVRPLLVDWLD